MTRRVLEKTMKISDLEKRNAWLSFASAALMGLGADTKYELDELSADAGDLADEMLEEYLERFEPGYERPEEDEEEEEEDEEEEEENPRPKRRTKR